MELLAWITLSMIKILPKRIRYLRMDRDKACFQTFWARYRWLRRRYSVKHIFLGFDLIKMSASMAMTMMALDMMAE